MKIEISNEQTYERYEQQQNIVYGRPIEAADPKLLENLSSLSLCPKCLQPHGKMRLWYGKLVEQHCDCEERNEGKWGDGRDFNTGYETCYCCGLEVLESGSKYSSFFCKDCKKAIYKINEAAGRCAIPVGRHSFMNGIWFNKSAPLDEAVSAFVGKANSMGNLIVNVNEHKVLILRHQLKVLQLPENASLLELTKASFHIDRKQAKKEALLSIVEHALQAQSG